VLFLKLVDHLLMKRGQVAPVHRGVIVVLEMVADIKRRVRLKKRERKVLEWFTGNIVDFCTHETCCTNIPGPTVQQFANHCGRTHKPRAIRQSIQNGMDHRAAKMISSTMAFLPTPL
jgi:hypothetical protein